MATNEALITANNAVEIRQNMAKMEIVKKALTVEEMRIFKASTMRPVENYDDGELAIACKDAFDFIINDIGYNKPNSIEWGKTMMRMAIVLKRYYPTLTMNEIAMAFELLAVGKLDGYLPKDSQGNPDRKHYQQFNIEYLSKILNAYRKARAFVLKKARDVMPQPQPQRTAQEIRDNRQMVVEDIMNYYLRYKYTGRLNCGSSLGELLTYRELARIGYVPEMEVTLDEQRNIIGSTLAKKMDFSRMAINRRMAIKQAFETMVNDEVQLTDYFENGK